MKWPSFGAVLMLLAVGCTESVSIVAQPGDIAVGARYRLAVLDSSCDNTGATSFVTNLAATLAFNAFVTSEGRPALALPPLRTSPSCRKLRIKTITDVTSSAPNVLAVVERTVEDGIALIELEARAVGSAELRVVVESSHSSQTAVATFQTAKVAHVDLTPHCEPGTEEHYIAVGASSQYDFGLRGESGQPLVGFGYLPIEPRSLNITYPSYFDSSGRQIFNFRSLVITWPLQSGMLTVSSPDDLALKRTVTLFDQSAYTSLEFQHDTNKTADLSNPYGVPYYAQGVTGTRKSCYYDPIPRHYFTDTPGICNLSLGLGSPKATDLMASGIVVYGVSAGTCRLHAEVPKTTLTGVIDIPVR